MLSTALLMNKKHKLSFIWLIDFLLMCMIAFRKSYFTQAIEINVEYDRSILYSNSKNENCFKLLKKAWIWDPLQSSTCTILKGIRIPIVFDLVGNLYVLLFLILCYSAWAWELTREHQSVQVVASKEWRSFFRKHSIFEMIRMSVTDYNHVNATAVWSH